MAYPVDFPPGTLLGHFHDQCERKVGKTDEILTDADAKELRRLLDYANWYHHENPAYATEIINDAELVDFTKRTLKFMRR